MRPLLRSTILCNTSDPPELLLQNLIALDKSGLVPDIPEERAIWDAVRGFARAYQHVPEFPTLQAQLADAKDLSALDYLVQMRTDPIKIRGDFAVLLERFIEERRNSVLLEALRQARAVATTGLQVDDKVLRGTDAAAQLLRDQLRAVDRAPGGVKLSGEVTSDAKEMREEYQRAKMNPVAGNYCGLQQIDTTIRGSKNRELWVHAAYSSHMKSTFALNWCYHLSVFFQSSVVFFSLEMNYEQVRRQLAAMHSFHFRFRDVRHRLGLQASEKTDTGLDYERIRDGQLSPREEEFYDLVLSDLEDERNRYGKIHVEVADPDKPAFKVADIQNRSEALYSEAPFVKVFVDHSLLIDPEGKYSSTTEKLNEIFKDLKKLARGFRRGTGMDVTVLHQINRNGLASALKKKESGRLPRYDMTNLSQSSQTEQSADVVTTTWVDDDLRSRNLVLFDCLKMRDGAPFMPFYGNVRWPCRRILTCHTEIPQDLKPEARAGKRASKVDASSAEDLLNALT